MGNLNSFFNFEQWSSTLATKSIDSKKWQSQLKSPRANVINNYFSSNDAVFAMIDAELF